jgi:hypothetical protein
MQCDGQLARQHAMSWTVVGGVGVFIVGNNSLWASSGHQHLAGSYCTMQAVTPQRRQGCLNQKPMKRDDAGGENKQLVAGSTELASMFPAAVYKGAGPKACRQALAFQTCPSLLTTMYILTVSQHSMQTLRCGWRESACIMTCRAYASQRTSVILCNPSNTLTQACNQWFC